MTSKKKSRKIIKYVYNSLETETDLLVRLLELGHLEEN